MPVSLILHERTDVQGGHSGPWAALHLFIDVKQLPKAYSRPFQCPSYLFHPEWDFPIILGVPGPTWSSSQAHYNFHLVYEALPSIYQPILISPVAGNSQPQRQSNHH
jgi:hypothetical protein